MSILAAWYDEAMKLTRPVDWSASHIDMDAAVRQARVHLLASAYYNEHIHVRYDSAPPSNVRVVATELYRPSLTEQLDAKYLNTKPWEKK